MMRHIQSSWKRFGSIIFLLALGGIAGLLWMGSPADKQYGFLTLTLLGLGALAIFFEVFKQSRAAGQQQSADAAATARFAPGVTLPNADMDSLLQAEQLRHPETISLPLAIKPNARNAVPLWVGLVALVGFAAYSVVKFRLSGTGLLITGAVACGFAILVLWLRRRYYSGTSLFVDQHEAGLIPAFGRRKAVSPATIRNIALRRVRYGKSSVDRLIVVGKNGRALLAVNWVGFSVADAALFAAALRVPIDENWELVTASKLDREIPGAVSGVDRYATVLGVVVAIALFVAILIFTLQTGH